MKLRFSPHPAREQSINWESQFGCTGGWPHATAACLLVAILSNSSNAQTSIVWEPFGAAPNTGGQVENLGDGEVSGAINAVTPHPNDENVLYVGAVNGGIWMTAEAMQSAPKWKHLTDDQPSLAIGALEFDPTDAGFKTLVAGTGQFSSFGAGGARAGLLRTTDGGSTWTVLGGGGLAKGLNVSGVAPRGNVIVVSAVTANNSNERGIWRSTDTGVTWRQISGSSASGLPQGACFDLASDPKNATRLFTNAGGRFYRSDDTGATWTKTSSAEMELQLANAENVETAVGHHDNVYVAIVGTTGELAAVFHSNNGGNDWTNLGVPKVGSVGIHPGRQGTIHLSIAADPGSANLCYIGGDRQHGTMFPTVPNAIGARDFSGCLFRGDAAAPAAKRWAHLTHSSSLGGAGGGTAHGSAPHADSRDMDVAKNGVLIEGDDGGVYKRTEPQKNSGDWFSMNGNLQTAEYHGVAWDSNADIVIAGAQDTGTGEQLASLQPRFRSIATADGGVVVVDDASTPGFSIRYSSNQFLGGFRRRIYDAGNNLQSATFVPLVVIGGGNVGRQFYTPIALNAVEPERLIIGGSDAVYESDNQGDTCRRLTPSIAANGMGLDTIAYGSSDNPDVLYVGAGSDVFVRTSPHPVPLKRSSTYTAGPVRGITLDPAAGNRAVVISPFSVQLTADAGATWTDLTGNLATLNPGILHSIAYISAPAGGPSSILIGSENGVFVRQITPVAGWARLASGLPRAPVYHLEYDATDDILLAGTLGRGAWRLATPTPGAAILAAAGAAAPAALSQPNGAANDTKSQPVGLQLRDGVIVDRDGKRVYLMQPNGGIEAVQLDTGKSLWVTKSAEKPLEVVGETLVTQAAAPKDANVVKMVALDATSGKEKVEAEHALPPGVNSSIDETFEGSFMSNVTAAGENVFVTWQFVERPAVGLPPGFERGIAPGAEKAIENDAPEVMRAERVEARSGVIQMNLNSGETASLNIEPPIAMAAGADQIAQPEGAERLKNIEGEQFESVDGRHIVGSVKTGKGAEWERYTLSIHERESGERIGQIKTHLPIVPLIVIGEQVLYETSPFTGRVGEKLVDTPLSIRVASLKNNREELWNRPIRDTSYQGPLPP